MFYIGKYKITEEEDLYYKKLLEINDLAEDNKNIGKQNDFISIACVEFINGNYVTIDLASGSTNYYDNICLYDKNGNELICSDCNYDKGSYELFYKNDTYVIKKVVE